MFSFKKTIKVSLVLFALCFMLLTNTALAISEPGGPCCKIEDCAGTGMDCKCVIDQTKCDLAKKRDTGICVPSGKAFICPTSKFISLEEVITSTVNYLFMLAVVGCPLVIAIGAFLFLTSAGDPGKTKLAKQMILWACIGLAVILFSKMMKGIILGIITGAP